jgi:hypothetical protein
VTKISIEVLKTDFPAQSESWHNFKMVISRGSRMFIDHFMGL